MVLNPERIRAMQQIRQEFLSINNNPNTNIGVTVGIINEDDWEIIYKDLPGYNSSYKDSYLEDVELKDSLELMKAYVENNEPFRFSSCNIYLMKNSFISI